MMQACPDGSDRDVEGGRDLLAREAFKDDEQENFTFSFRKVRERELRTADGLVRFSARVGELARVLRLTPEGGDAFG